MRILWRWSERTRLGNGDEQGLILVDGMQAQTQARAIGTLVEYWREEKYVGLSSDQQGSTPDQPSQ